MAGPNARNNSRRSHSTSPSPNATVPPIPVPARPPTPPQPTVASGRRAGVTALGANPSSSLSSSSLGRRGVLGTIFSTVVGNLAAPAYTAAPPPGLSPVPDEAEPPSSSEDDPESNFGPGRPQGPGEGEGTPSPARHLPDDAQLRELRRSRRNAEEDRERAGRWRFLRGLGWRGRDENV